MRDAILLMPEQESWAWWSTKPTKRVAGTATDTRTMLLTAGTIVLFNPRARLSRNGRPAGVVAVVSATGILELATQGIFGDEWLQTTIAMAGKGIRGQLQLRDFEPELTLAKPRKSTAAAEQSLLGACPFD
jgi:hypothetical protein